MSTVAAPVDPAAVALGLERVRARIEAAGGDPERIRIVAVTKGQPAEAVDAAVAAGAIHAGESYAKELLAKAPNVDRAVRWHWIGRLQRNKVRQLAPLIALWESVDRPELAAEVARQAPGAAVLVQVDVAGLATQGGCAPTEVPGLVGACQDLGLDVRGLMAIGPQGSPEVVRAGFRTVRTLADGLGLPERSMGMSGDLEAAVAEGTTAVRVGTAIFGPRGGSSAMGN
jgi:pyridoxal phosphate enzyme (YggS family)